MKTKLLTLVLALGMCLSLAIPTLAADIVDSGKCGDDLTWILDSEGTLTISGRGDMWDFDNVHNRAPWVVLEENDIYMKNDIRNVILEKGVTSIGSYAFDTHLNLTNVVIPDGITSIGDGAFHQCYELSRIVIPASVLSIGRDALPCSKLCEIQVDAENPVYKTLDGVLYADDMSTLICYPAEKKGTAYSVPAGVTTIGRGAFRFNDYLTTIVLPETIVKIEDGAFAMCTALTNINLPKSITEIADETFGECHALTDITIPERVTKIGENAFTECRSLSSMRIPASVTNIGDNFNNPFYGCSSLTAIDVDPANTQYFSKDGALYTSANNSRTHKVVLMAYPAGGKGTVFSIPEDTVVGYRVFLECKNLTHVTFPKAVTSLGAHLFWKCDNLASITIPTSVTLIDNTIPILEECDNFSTVYYTGSREQWDAIDKRGDPFALAIIHYNSTGPDSQSAISPAAPAFTDVPASAYYAEPVAWAVEQGITTGTSATAFSPKQDCTNAQILTFLWRACGKPEPAIDNPFTNAVSDAYLQAAVWAYEQGMVTGTTFDSSAPCTRAMAVTYIWQACGSPAPETTASFTDVPADADYAQAVAWAVEQGVTTGTGDTTFSPDEVCNRGQIVTFLHRAMG